MNHTPISATADDSSILVGATVALHYNVIPSAPWYGEKRASGPASWLDLVHAELKRSPDALRYVEPLESFYSDVTIPFTRRQQLPVGALVEQNEAGQQSLRSATIEIDTIETVWEGDVAVVPPARIIAQFREAVVLFESGHFVYVPSFILQPPSDAAGAAAVVAEVLNPLHVSALTSLVSSSSAGYGQSPDDVRSRIKLYFTGETQRHDLVSFINARLASLVAPDSKANVFADLIRPVLSSAGWSDNQRSRARSSVSSLNWSNVHSASVEVVGSDHHGDIAAWCQSAASGTLRVGATARALAAIGQNILDVDNQDESEVADSLSQAVNVNDEVLLIHPTTLLRFSRSSRSFAKMRNAIGGCP